MIKRGFLFMIPLAGLLLQAGETTPTKAKPAPKPAAKQATANPGAASAQVFKDPATGQLRGIEPGDKVATPASARRSAPLRALTGPNGLKGIALNEDYMLYSVATKAPDGTLELSCEQNEAAAKAKMKQGSTGVKHDH